MAIKFTEIYPNHRWIEQDGKRVGELNRLSFGRCLWTVDINGRRGYGSFDCFSLTNAKKVSRHFLTGEKITLSV